MGNSDRKKSLALQFPHPHRVFLSFNVGLEVAALISVARILPLNVQQPESKNDYWHTGSQTDIVHRLNAFPSVVNLWGRDVVMAIIGQGN